MTTKLSSHQVALCITASILATCAAPAADSSVKTAPVAAPGWQKPAWLTDLGLGAKESYDDNLLGVSDRGMTPKSSWVSTVSPKVGVNFAPLLGDQKALQTLSLVYAPEFNFYHGFPSESYSAHKLGDAIKYKNGNFSFALDNAFLFNDGNHEAEIFALNQGADLGYKLTSKLAATLGYRYGSQYQQQLPSAVDSDQHYSSSEYQRVLLGLEGKPWSWLKVKLAGGPDFRNYNAMAPVNDHTPVKYYGEAVLTATLSPSQTLTFNYKQWQWVSSTGKVPYLDSSYALTYHWNATKQLGLDLGGKVMESDYTQGNEDGVLVSTQNSSLRDDMEYEVSAGVTYAFNTHFSANLAYTYDLGDNALNNLPAGNLANSAPWRSFKRQLVSLGLQYKF